MMNDILTYTIQDVPINVQNSKHLDYLCSYGNVYVTNNICFVAIV